MSVSFAANLRDGLASAELHRADTVDRHFDTLRIENGRTFAGFTFTLAIRANREQLLRGNVIELHAIAFTPKPRTVAAAIAYAGVNQMQMAGRTITGERYVIHPKIPCRVALCPTCCSAPGMNRFRRRPCRAHSD